MTGLEQARQVLGDDVTGRARAEGSAAPELTAEQVARLRVVLARPAADDQAA